MLRSGTPYGTVFILSLLARMVPKDRRFSTSIAMEVCTSWAMQRCIRSPAFEPFLFFALFQTTTWVCFRLEIMVVDQEVTYVSWRCGVVRYVLVVPLTKEIPIHCAAYHLDLLYIFCFNFLFPVVIFSFFYSFFFWFSFLQQLWSDSFIRIHI